MHSPITFPYVSMTVHHHYSPILGQKESKAGLALDLPRSWSQYPKVRVALSESQALPLTLGSPLLYFLPWDVPQWTLTPTSMATVTFPRVRGLYGLSHYLLVFPRHLLSFQGKVGEDMRKAGEVQVELGFQVQLPKTLSSSASSGSAASFSASSALPPATLAFHSSQGSSPCSTSTQMALSMVK